MLPRVTHIFFDAVKSLGTEAIPAFGFQNPFITGELYKMWRFMPKCARKDYITIFEQLQAEKAVEESKLDRIVVELKSMMRFRPKPETAKICLNPTSIYVIVDEDFHSPSHTFIEENVMISSKICVINTLIDLERSFGAEEYLAFLVPKWYETAASHSSRIGNLTATKVKFCYVQDNNRFTDPVVQMVLSRLDKKRKPEISKVS